MIAPGVRDHMVNPAGTASPTAPSARARVKREVGRDDPLLYFALRFSGRKDVPERGLGPTFLIFPNARDERQGEAATAQ